ncbi:Variable outer membrane protein (plasmid) [Borrelia coriaceae ATCC 43381]|uniref:Variable large protein n=2 Tax=Borrelia coriaceae TaxID=144 RepID=W5SVU9_9SPIR|nr:Variable outer membrane protein [Borrelia coriaceae ATCC 43381]
MVTDALGIKSDTKKEDIGKYFTAIEKTMTSVKEKLQAEVSKNGNYEKVREKVTSFIQTIEKIEKGAETAAGGAKGDEKIGGATKTGGQDATPAEADSVNKLVKGIGQIVGVVLENKGDATATKTEDNEQKTIAKLFSDNKSNSTDAIAAAASASIGAVSGADILKAIASSGDASDVAIDKAKDAASIAIAKKEDKSDLDASAKKDAIIAAGIALRAMAKGGKFAAKASEAKSAHAVNGAAASAVNKTLSTLIIAIRNTIDTGLKSIIDVLSKVKQEDKFVKPVETEKNK